MSKKINEDLYYCPDCKRNLKGIYFYNNCWTSSGKAQSCKNCYGRTDTTLISIEQREDLKAYFNEHYNDATYFKAKNLVHDWLDLVKLEFEKKERHALSLVLVHEIANLSKAGKIVKYNKLTWRVIKDD